MRLVQREPGQALDRQSRKGQNRESLRMPLTWKLSGEPRRRLSSKGFPLSQPNSWPPRHAGDAGTALLWDVGTAGGAGATLRW